MHREASWEEVDDRALKAFVREQDGAPGGLELPPVVIVIAAYNEEGAIGTVLDALPARVCDLPAVPLVVVDGASDGTAAVARRHGALVCDVPVNRGQGAALRLGYRIARDCGARYLITTDADGQYDPADMDSLLAPILLDEADFVTGCRRLGSEETDDPLRRLGVRVFAWLVSGLVGQRVTDTSFGLRAMRAEVTAGIGLRQPQYQAAELLIGLISRGYRVAELPGRIRPRLAGKSKKGHNLLFGFRYAQVVFGTWWRERRSRSVP